MGIPLIDAVTSGETGANNQTAITRAHTVAGVNRGLAVGVSLRIASGQSVQSVTYNGVALTLVKFQTQGSMVRSELWYLHNPPVGTANVVITLAGSATRFVYTIVSLTNTAQSNAIRGSAGANASDTANPSVSLSSNTLDLVMDIFGAATVPTATVGAGQTERSNLVTTGASANMRGGCSTEPGAATTTMSWTLNSVQNWAIAAMSIIGIEETPTPPTAPATPTAPTSKTATSATWTAPSLTAGATSAKSRWRVGAGAWTENAATPGQTHTIGGLPSNTGVEFQWGMSNGVGDSWSGSVNFTTPPAAPTALQATPGNAQVALQWTAPANATGVTYNVKRAITSGGTLTTVATGLAVTNHTDTGRTNGQTVYYVVTALGPGGESANSVEASATPVAPPPVAPADLTAEAGDGQVALDWPDVAGATGYNIKRSSTPGGPYSLVGSNVPTSGGINSGLTQGQTYYFVVTALGPGGESPNSVERSATPVAAQAPAPGPVPAPTLDTKTQTMGRLNAVSMPANATALRLVVSKNGGAEVETDVVLGEKPLITGLASGDVVVVLFEAEGPGGIVRSASLTFNPSPGVPDIPVVSVTTAGVYRVEGYAALTPGATHFRLVAKRVGEPDEAFYLVRDLVAPLTPLEVSGLQTPETVFAWMAIGNPAGGAP